MSVSMKRFLAGVTATFLILLLLAWQMSPLLANKALKDYFARHGTLYAADRFQLNPFTGDLSIAGITLTTASSPQLRMGRLEGRVKLSALLQRRWEFTALRLEELDLTTSGHDSAWLPPGLPALRLPLWPLRIPTSEDLANGVVNFLPAEDIHASGSWPFRVRYVSLRGATIRHLGATPENWTIDTLAVNELQDDGQQWKVDLSVKGAINTTRFDVQTRFEGQPDAFNQWLEVRHLEGDLRTIRSWLPDALQHSDADFETSGELLVSRNMEGLAYTSTRGTLTLRHADLRFPEVTVQAALLDAEFGHFRRLIGSSGPILTQARATLSALAPGVLTRRHGKVLLGAGRLHPTQITFSGQGEQWLTSDAVRLDTLLIGDDSSEEPNLAPLLKADAAELRNPRYSDGRLLIDELTLTEPAVSLDFAPDGTLRNALRFEDMPSWLVSTSERPATVAIHRIAMTGQGSMLIGLAGQPADAPTHMILNQFTAEGLDGEHPEQALHVQASGSTAGLGELVLDSRLWLFGDQFETDTRGWLHDYAPATLERLLARPAQRGASAPSNHSARFLVTLYDRELYGEWQSQPASAGVADNAMGLRTLRKTLDRTMPPLNVAPRNLVTPIGAAPDQANQETTTPDVATPDVATPDVATPDTATPTQATSEVAMPDTETPASSESASPATIPEAAAATTAPPLSAPELVWRELKSWLASIPLHD